MESEWTEKIDSLKKQNEELDKMIQQLKDNINEYPETRVGLIDQLKM